MAAEGLVTLSTDELFSELFSIRDTEKESLKLANAVCEEIVSRLERGFLLALPWDAKHWPGNGTRYTLIPPTRHRSHVTLGDESTWRFVHYTAPGGSQRDVWSLLPPAERPADLPVMTKSTWKSKPHDRAGQRGAAKKAGVQTVTAGQVKTHDGA
jgi:hypothetical protein